MHKALAANLVRTWCSQQPMLCAFHRHAPAGPRALRARSAHCSRNTNASAFELAKSHR
ncbi:hypothetical protein POSPLADRAFT_1041377 [Postia placenta MAD-698-R-SB12]|uniref:Uncharacterized protein n=1 Tax=Postia placenta MAD-698-R-SB12 TaxID=670580 RepID=A0A1X6MPB9_9APHY|nr:hypothetical protein POSPLADRAFT_1041377 [Postia placenta MAD-698-R-SB12]OSX58225.1 hypothetical protein POSPLADRAFT_1041377 [Postia placenta MAD-698-R-SB12]